MKNISKKQIFIFLLFISFSNGLFSQIIRDTTTLKHTELSAGTYTYASGNQVYPYSGWGLYINKTRFKIIIDLGDDYNWGSNSGFDVLLDSLSIKVSYNYFYGGSGVLCDEIISLSLDESHPETHYLIAELNTGMWSDYSLELNFGQYYCPVALVENIRCRIIRSKDILSNSSGTHSVRLEAPEPLEGKKYLFSWDINGTDGQFPTLAYYNTGHFQFQIMKLYNTNEEFVINGTGNYEADVDWSKALDLEINSFDRELILSLTEGSGYYIWRVRAIGFNYLEGNTDPRYWGEWSNYGSFTDGSIGKSISAGGTSPYLFEFTDNEEDINWIYKRVFAEDNRQVGKGIKIGESMSYANGLQQVVQSQSYQDTKDTVMAQGIYYDYAGRSALQTMSVPAKQNHLEYKADLMYNSSLGVYNVIDFDSTGNYNNPHSVESNTSSFGYYSVNNTTDLYVPDAEGYPFNRTLFYSGTGKMKESGSAAKTHRIKPDSIRHTIRKYYSGVGDPELIKVFGKEAPDGKLVTKEITVDQNNVASVTYTDNKGKIIATCLANNPEMNPALDSIPSATESPDSTSSKVKNGVLNGNLIVDQNNLYLFDTTEVLFEYKITPQELEDPCVNFCKTCDYIVHRYLLEVSSDSVWFESTDVINPGACPTGMLLNEDSTMTLLPGDYLMVREILVNNANASGDLYLTEYLNTIEQAYQDTFQLIYNTYETFIENNDIIGFYDSINNSVDFVVLDPSIFNDSVLTIPFGKCDILEVPIQVCPASPCDVGAFEIYGDLIDSILGSGFKDTIRKGNFFYCYYPSTYDTLIDNMINDAVAPYDCDTLWDVWQSTVYTYDNIRTACIDEGIEVPTLLSLFLDGVGRRINDYTIVYNDLRRREYSLMYLPNGWSCDLDCAAGFVDTMDVFENHIVGTITPCDEPYQSTIPSENYDAYLWEVFYQCVNSIDPDAEVEDPVELCEERCEGRRGGFKDDLRQLIYRSSLGSQIVEGDEYGTVLDTLWHTGGYYAYDQSVNLPPDVGMSLEELECYTNALVNNCKDYCQLSYTIAPSGDRIYTSNMDTLAEFAKAMIFDYEIDFLDSDALVDWGTPDVDYDTVTTANQFSEPQHRDSVEIYWEDIYGGVGSDNGHKIIQTRDGGYLLIGNVSPTSNASNPLGEHNISDQSLQSYSDYWVVKLKSDYTMDWDYLYTGNSIDILIDVIQLPDGSYILGGYSSSSNDEAYDFQDTAYGGSDFWIIKINTDGIIQWQRTYGSAGDEILSSMLLMKDGFVVLGGTSINEGDKDYYVVKIDPSDGSLNWKINYSSNGNSEDYLHALCEDHEHNIMLAGASNGSEGNNKTSYCRGGFDYWLINIDSDDHTIVWDKTIGGSDDDIATSIIEDHNQNLVIAGYSESNQGTGEHSAVNYGNGDVWVVKLLPTLDHPILWDKSYGSENLEGVGTLHGGQGYYASIFETKTGHYIIGSACKDFVVDNTDTRSDISTSMQKAYWLAYIDAEGGYVWDRLFQGTTINMDGEMNTYDPFFVQTENNKFLIISSSSQMEGNDKSSDPFGVDYETDYWAMQIGYECDSMSIAFRWTDTLSLAPQIDTYNVVGITCEETSIEMVMNNIYNQKDQIIAQKLQEFEDQYITDCTLPESLNDLWEAKYEIAYHHYTLYYYDRMGRLIKTVPPAGVVKSADLTERTVLPDHRLVTQYEYNSLGQLIKQYTPDGGESQFYYNQVGQLRFSVNAQQKVDQTFSYTNYDNLGRIIEVGLADSTSNYLDQLNVANYPSTGLSEQNFTVYTTPHPDIKGIDGSNQGYILNRVSYTSSYTASGDSVQTVYSYDPHGNVEWLVQDLPGLGSQYVYYTYDLLSGNVLKVAYNKGRADQFFYRYSYDADNRIVLTESSCDGEIWDKDAAYEYYLHGPLKRTELGEDKVQGLDYSYTIQGWLKAVNNPSMILAGDPGADGATGSDFARDVYAQALGYYQGDFRSDAFDGTGGYGTGLVQKSATTSNELFNGNIATWTNNTSIENGPNFPAYANEATAFTYRYDELQRIKESHFYSGTGLVADGAYDMVASYGANGNLELLDRKAVDLPGDGLMDQLKYTYQENGNGDILKNRLLSVEDLVSTDLDEYNDIQFGTLTYEYDSIGNLIRNIAEGIDTIKWTAYGKVAEVIKDPSALNNENLRFTYDAAGNRVMKEVISQDGYLANETTYYIRDAQGNVLSTYKQTNQVDRKVYNLQEQYIYGSSRLGVRRSNLEVKSVINPGTVDEFIALTNQYPRKSENEIMSLPYLKTQLLLSQNQAITQQLLQYNFASMSTAIYSNGKIDYNIEQESMSDINSAASGKIANNVAVSETKDGQIGIIAITYQSAFSFTGGSLPQVCKVLDRYGNMASGSNEIKSGYRNASIAIEAIQGSDKHFLFTTKSSIPYFNLISKTGSDFEVESVNNPLSEDTTGFGKKMAVIADYTQNKALYLRRYESGVCYIHSYEIGTTTVQNKGIKDSFISSDVSGEGDMQISTDGKLLAVANRLGGSALSGDATEIRLYEIDEDRTQITFVDSILLVGEQISNFDFSPENDYIYYSGVLIGNSADWNIKRIKMLDYQVENLFNNASSVIRRGHDGRMYYGYRGSSVLHFIENPDAAALDLGNNLGSIQIETESTWNHTGGVPLQPHLIYVYEPEFFVRELGNKYYELSDHLGNVRAVVQDTKEPGEMATYDATVTTATDFYPFGMQMPKRHVSSSNYRFGFNGQEKDDEIYGSTGSSYTAEFWQYDARIGKRWNIDPVVKHHESPYAAFAGNPIWFADPNGADSIPSTSTSLEYTPGKDTYTLPEVTVSDESPHGKSEDNRYNQISRQIEAMNNPAYLDFVKRKTVENRIQWGSDEYIGSLLGNNSPLSRGQKQSVINMRTSSGGARFAATPGGKLFFGALSFGYGGGMGALLSGIRTGIGIMTAESIIVGGQNQMLLSHTFRHWGDARMSFSFGMNVMKYGGPSVGNTSFLTTDLIVGAPNIYNRLGLGYPGGQMFSSYTIHSGRFSGFYLNGTVGRMGNTLGGARQIYNLGKFNYKGILK